VHKSPLAQDEPASESVPVSPDADQTPEGLALCDWLLELRTNAGLSQVQAAEAIGASAREIRRWETKNSPGGVNLLRLLSAYGVRFDQVPPLPAAVNAELQALRLALEPLGNLVGVEEIVEAQGRQMTTALRGLAREVRGLSPEQDGKAQPARQGRAAR
jgi:transcriptional regulator with XRE-family HTH domain